MNDEKNKIRSIAIELVEILKKYNVTYRDAREVLGMASRIIDRTTINSDSLNIKMESDTPSREGWVSEQKSTQN